MQLSELLGNVGEFVGAIAVVITLVYLAVQVRQNSLQLRSKPRIGLEASAPNRG